MPTPTFSPDSFASFGELLRFLRRRARLTQRELSIAVGYSEAHLSRLELDQRLPDVATVAAVFVPALDLEAEPATASRLLELAALARQAPAPADGAAPPPEPAPGPEAAGPSGNLPHPLTGFVGREPELARVERLLAESRLVTLTGTGGCGKTRLALRVAEGVAAHYAHHAWFVDLAPLADAALVDGTVAAALGTPAPRDRPIFEALLAFLRPRQLLLVVDNAEHVISAVAHLSERLLLACPYLHLLVTSREPLNLPGETVFAVPPLESGGVASDGVRLFVERARDRLPDFELLEAQASTVTGLCQQLDGLPLAIELAAARLTLLSVEQIAARLDDRFGLLTAGHRTALPRQKTLRATMDWSYELLPEAERALFRCLAVFAGGFTLESLAAVRPKGHELDLLALLAAKSLVVVERRPGGDARYRLLETVRAYAREQLRAAGEEAQAVERHLRYFLGFAQAGEQGLQGPAQAEWLARLDLEHDNLRAALEAASTSEAPALAEAGLRLALALSHYWFVRGYDAESGAWIKRLLASAKQPQYTSARARALALARRWADSPAEAQRLLRESLELSQALEDEPALAAAHFSRAGYGWLEDDPAEARANFEQSLRLYRGLGDRWHLARTLAELGEFAQVRQDDRPLARACYQESLDIARDLGDKRGIAIALVHLGDVAIEQGDLDAARQFCRQGLAAAGEVNDWEGLAWGLNGLGIVAMGEGRLEEAAKLCEESLELSQTWGGGWHIAIRRYWLARVVVYQEEFDRAAALFERNVASSRAMGFDWGCAVSLHGLGDLAARRGDLEAARTLYAEALPLLYNGRYGYSLAYVLDSFAALALAQPGGRPERALRLFAAADALREAINSALLPPELAERVALVNAAAQALDAVSVGALTEQGRGWTLAEAVAYAMSPDAGLA